MTDKIVYAVAETGTYSTAAPNPHVDLSGFSPSGVSVAQLFSAALADGETATVTVRKDPDNWACYGHRQDAAGTVGALFGGGTPDTLSLENAELLDSAGAITTADAVDVIAEYPEQDTPAEVQGNLDTHKADIFDHDNVESTGITTGQILEWDGSQFLPGDKTVGGGGWSDGSEITYYDLAVNKAAAGLITISDGTTEVIDCDTEGPKIAVTVTAGVGYSIELQTTMTAPDLSLRVIDTNGQALTLTVKVGAAAAVPVVWASDSNAMGDRGDYRITIGLWDGLADIEAVAMKIQDKP